MCSGISAYRSTTVDIIRVRDVCLYTAKYSRGIVSTKQYVCLVVEQTGWVIEVGAGAGAI